MNVQCLDGIVKTHGHFTRHPRVMLSYFLCPLSFFNVFFCYLGALLSFKIVAAIFAKYWFKTLVSSCSVLKNRSFWRINYSLPVLYAVNCRRFLVCFAMPFASSNGILESFVILVFCF